MVENRINDNLKDDALLIWDCNEDVPNTDVRTVYWRGFRDENSENHISITALVDENANYLRNQYLAWIHDLGESRIKGRRLLDHLEIRKGLSYWWMTLFAEKCNIAKSPQIEDAIRFLAFEKFVNCDSVKKIVLETTNKNLSDTFKIWCFQKGFTLECRLKKKSTDNKLLFKRIYRFAPPSLQGMIWLFRYLFSHWSLRGTGLEEWCNTKGKLTFVSFLFNLVPESVGNRHYESRYWGRLPDKLVAEGNTLNWLHLYVRDEILPDSSSAAHYLKKLNKSANGTQVHVTLDTFLSLNVIFVTLKDWFFLRRQNNSLQPELLQTEPFDSCIWPLFRDDWNNSMTGQHAVNNLLFLNMFERAVDALPKQKACVFLKENQGWEFSWTSLWKNKGHGTLIAALHSTIRFWDLRYFYDARTFTCTENNALPWPDTIAVNGEAAMNTIAESGYPKKNLVDVEALRYLYLLKNSSQQRQAYKASDRSAKLLVLGDYMYINTQKQMQLLYKSRLYLPKRLRILVKPHPNCPINLEDYPELEIELTNASIQDLLQGCTVVFSSSQTSAAVDAYCAGVPVISAADPDTFNLSPLRGVSGVKFVSDSTSLVKALNSFISSDTQLVNNYEYFFTLDNNLPRWRSLLKNALE